jgi:hypothetical protein
MNEDTPEPPLSTSPPPSTLRSIGRSLSNRNYRLFFVGQGISLIGTWMTRVATAWLIFRLSGSDAAFLLGVAGFAGQSPSFFLAPLAGVLVDRWNRHQLLVVTQVQCQKPQYLGLPFDNKRAIRRRASVARGGSYDFHGK